MFTPKIIIRMTLVSLLTLATWQQKGWAQNPVHHQKFSFLANSTDSTDSSDGESEDGDEYSSDSYSETLNVFDALNLLDNGHSSQAKAEKIQWVKSTLQALTEKIVKLQDPLTSKAVLTTSDSYQENQYSVTNYFPYNQFTQVSEVKELSEETSPLMVVPVCMMNNLTLVRLMDQATGRSSFHEKNRVINFAISSASIYQQPKSKPGYMKNAIVFDQGMIYYPDSYRKIDMYHLLMQYHQIQKSCKQALYLQNIIHQLQSTPVKSCQHKVTSLLEFADQVKSVLAKENFSKANVGKSGEVMFEVAL